MGKEKVQAEHSTGISSLQLSVQPKWHINKRLFVFVWNMLKPILLYFVNPMTEIKSCSQLIAISYNVAVLKFVQVSEPEMFPPDTTWHFVIGMCFSSPLHV